MGLTVGVAKELPLDQPADRTAIDVAVQQAIRSTGSSITMWWSRLKLNTSATESQKGIVLTVCLLVMSAMCVALIWQAQVISEQRDNIKWLQALKFGG
jgi:hypothetical protein